MGRNLLVSLVVALLASSAVAQDTGLLLGLADREGNASTVWVGQQGVATFARRAGDGYWLWKDDGFWHVVNEDLTWSGGRATVTITDPDGKVTVIKGAEGRPDTDYHVMYVAPRTIGLMWKMHLDSSEPQGVSGQLGGLGGESTRMTDFIFRNLEWSDLATAVEVDSVFDQRTVKSFFESPEYFFSGRREVFLDMDVSPTNWTLRRQMGHWSLFGRLMASSAVVGSSGEEYPVSVVDNDSLGGKYVKGPKWSRMLSEYPDAIDSTVSPDGKLTVIVTPTDVFVHRSSGGSLGRRVQRVRVASNRIVMTQWFEGGDVRKVAGEVAKIKR